MTQRPVSGREIPSHSQRIRGAMGNVPDMNLAN
jgi:hypothetical protein